MSRTVLVVDDSASLRSVVRLCLEKEGFAVTEAETGRAALEIVTKAPQPFDLVVSDLNMPEMDGLSFVSKMRSSEQLKYTPVVMLTTENGEARKTEGLQAGVKAWLTKPFHPDQLRATVSRIIV